MKKYLAGLITGALLMMGLTVFANEVSSWIAQKATFDVYVAGDKFESDKPIVAIEGSTYLPLKAIGDVLDVPVQWNAEQKRVEVGMASPAGAPIVVITSKPTQTPAVNETFGSKKTIYYIKTDVFEVDSSVQHTLITYQGEQYLDLKALGAIRIRDGNDYYIEVPGRERVLILANRTTTENSQAYMGSTFVRLSAVGLRARIDGGNAYLELIN